MNTSGAQRGSLNPKAKLTEEKVREIRASTEKGSVLSKIYGVSQVTICLIRQRKAWRHVP